MSATATSPPLHASRRGAAASAPQAGASRAGAPPARSRTRFLRASTTPGTLRLLLVGLVAACLAWGVLAALTVAGRTPPFSDRERYQHDMAVAAADLKAEAGVIVLALGMAVGCAWGLSRRLAEYR